MMKKRTALLLGFSLMYSGQFVSASGDGCCPADEYQQCNTDKKPYTVPLLNLPEGAKELEMVLIPSGSFTMGSPEDEKGRDNQDWPAHPVNITHSFFMSKYEITQAQWESLVGKHRSKFQGNPNRPVDKASWNECQKFIKKLNKLGEGTFRLPTEAEWEYACRAGTKTRFFFGDNLDSANDFMWWKGNNQGGETHEVGLKKPNPWGLYDMHGNVSEWVADCWSKPSNRSPQDDPFIQPKGFLQRLNPWSGRVFRGGCYFMDGGGCRAADRQHEQRFDYHYSLGFRVVKENNEEE